jgi:hypothetical protein
VAELADAPDLGSGVRKDVPVRLRSAPLLFAWAFFFAANATIITSQSHDPFSFLSPTVEISAADRARVEAGETVVNIVPANRAEIATVAMSQTSMTPERLVQWWNDIEHLKAGLGALRVQRLSPAASVEEFSALELPEEDLRDIRDCHPGACNVKLTVPEMERMRREMRGAGAGWMARGKAVFREIARDRVAGYLAGGLDALAPYADGHGESSRAVAFASLIANSAFLNRIPALKSLIVGHDIAAPGATSFIYWSVEEQGTKPIASATHTSIVTAADPAHPAVLIAGKQIYATHYSSTSLNIVALVRRPEPGGAPYYLVVVNRSTIDAAGGLFGGVTRHVIETRTRRDAPALFTKLRRKIEAGPPPVRTR